MGPAFDSRLAHTCVVSLLSSDTFLFAPLVDCVVDLCPVDMNRDLGFRGMSWKSPYTIHNFAPGTTVVFHVVPSGEADVLHPLRKTEYSLRDTLLT